MPSSWSSNFTACLRASLETAACVLESLAVILVNGLGTLASVFCVSGITSQLTYFP
ncbi:hypothetical protein CCHR01_10424 [Colletotrichum chrysophilum]|uniref:Uncharacterized protein n=1 Tax=Colletotrichum chrysophilum TaxID=1836956 RepID=A0AAD9AF34_9PEZI|nr:hypothetical protein CCHR01_10424 [Colletotrichum chrysophilum]